MRSILAPVGAVAWSAPRSSPSKPPGKPPARGVGRGNHGRQGPQALAQPGATFNAGGGSGGQTITINPNTTYQSMVGFGASSTDSSAWLVYNSSQRNAIMSQLFDPDPDPDPGSGAGLNFLRQPIAASDYSRSAYAAAGIPVSLVTPQNEPDNDPGNYPGMKWPAGDEATFINSYLGPAIQNAGPSTKILGYDHNWDDPGYPTTVLANAGNYTAGTAWHCYSDPDGVSAQTQVHNAYPNKDTYFTECSTASM
jgi:O-glycosyl hydrolase